MTSLLDASRTGATRASGPTGDDRLLTWLRLLGWDVRLGRRGHFHVAVARCVIGSAEVEVCARGECRTAAVVKLFGAAVERASAAA